MTKNAHLNYKEASKNQNIIPFFQALHFQISHLLLVMNLCAQQFQAIPHQNLPLNVEKLLFF